VAILLNLVKPLQQNGVVSSDGNNFQPTDSHSRREVSQLGESRLNETVPCPRASVAELTTSLHWLSGEGLMSTAYPCIDQMRRRVRYGASSRRDINDSPAWLAEIMYCS